MAVPATPAVMCWRCKTRPVARRRLRPWQHGALCRPCGNEIDRALLEVAVVVLLLEGWRGVPAVRRPAAEIRQYDGGDPRWLIRTTAPLPNPHEVPDWSTCPGTLHQDYDTRAGAEAVARWWGYEPAASRPGWRSLILSRRANSLTGTGAVNCGQAGRAV
jgi:hypothetical protein